MVHLSVHLFEMDQKAKGDPPPPFAEKLCHAKQYLTVSIMFALIIVIVIDLWSLILYTYVDNDNYDVNGDVDVDVDDADDDDSVFYVDVFDLVYVCKSWARCDFGSVCSDASLFIFSWKGKLRREFINMKSFMLAQMQNFILISC